MGIAWYRKAKQKKWRNSPPETIKDNENHERGRLKIRPKKKRFKKENILALIRERVLEYINKQVSIYNGKTKLQRQETRYSYAKFYFAEDFALEFNVPCHIIEQCFAILNKEGLMHQAKHGHVHDGTRNHNFSGSCNDWIASKYFIRLPFDDYLWHKKHDREIKK